MVTREILSGSTDGLAILVAASASDGTTIHTADLTANDEIWLYVTNNTTVDVQVTIEFGGIATENTITKTIISKDGLFPIVPGLVLSNNKVVKAFADTPNVVSITGYVNRIS